jgi:hypothetical protein
MSVLTLFRRFRGSFRTDTFEHGMEAELRHHLEMEAEALIARGMTPEAARDTARRRFGSVALVKDDCRESWGMRAVDTVTQDVRFAIRNLRKYPPTPRSSVSSMRCCCVRCRTPTAIAWSKSASSRRKPGSRMRACR